MNDLKAKAYDIIAQQEYHSTQIKQLQNDLNAVNQQISEEMKSASVTKAEVIEKPVKKA